MKDNFDRCLAFVLKEEGGYTDDTRDPGGITNLGVTRATWQQWVGHVVSPQEMKDLTPSLVTPLYRERYWNPVKGDIMPSGLDLCLFDSGVNQGPGTAVKVLQTILGVTADGAFGAKTAAALEGKPLSELVQKFCQERTARYHNTKNFDLYGKGWLKRVERCQSEALAHLP
jgi:lysozyme family protein